ncbi:MAG: hypothetical protein KA200_00240 [Burkholderiales bacterium]|nr:hypothetical protein [Burkholderiales bacterium]
MSAVLERPDPLAAFMAEARAIAFHAADHGTRALYERLKALLQVRVPDLDWRGFEAATLKLARIAGV